MWNWMATNVVGPDSQWFWAMASFFAVAISLSLIYRQISLQRQANLLHTLGEMDKRWNSKEMVQARKQACNSYLADKLRINADQGDVLGFFEDVGVYLERKVFDSEAVWDKYSYYIEHYWAMYQPHINEFRAETKDNTWYEKFQVLHKEMQAYGSKKGVVINPKSQEEIRRFIRGEIGGNAQQVAPADS
ncbi:hypothetical protein MTYP_02020 [Methylophilaceae bacterium]|nr:hypothetical protein MTYP_02020 [Methylophilaceae bacterium]